MFIEIITPLKTKETIKGKTLRRRQVYKKKIQWLCSTYIEKGVKACKGIRIDDAELQGLMRMKEFREPIPKRGMNSTV